MGVLIRMMLLSGKQCELNNKGYAPISLGVGTPKKQTGVSFAQMTEKGPRMLPS